MLIDSLLCFIGFYEVIRVLRGIMDEGDLMVSGSR